MSPQAETVRRRPDGSIDTAFYAARASVLRRHAINSVIQRWFSRMVTTPRLFRRPPVGSFRPNGLG